MACAKGAILLVPPDHTFNYVPLSIRRLVDVLVSRLVLAGRDHRLDSTSATPAMDARVALPLFPAKRPGQPRRWSSRRATVGSNALLSYAWPAVTWRATMKPCLSQTRWILVLKPPRERPSAWSSGSWTCVYLRPPSRRELLPFSPLRRQPYWPG